MNVSPLTTTPKTRRRGIQPGQNVFAGKPKLDERRVRSACESAFATARVPSGCKLSWKRNGLSSLELRQMASVRGLDLPPDFSLGGFGPDGGIFYLSCDGGEPLPFLAAEAKYQGIGGNAIERWYKNYHVAKFISPSIMFLTFITGPGAEEGRVMKKTLNHALVQHALEHAYMPVRHWERVYDHGPSMFAAPAGFDQKHVRATMVHALDVGIAAVLRR